VAFDAIQPQKPERHANIKFENNPNDGFNEKGHKTVKLV